MVLFSRVFCARGCAHWAASLLLVVLGTSLGLDMVSALHWLAQFAVQHADAFFGSCVQLQGP